MDISPPPPLHPSLLLSLCFTAFHNIVFFFFFITKHPARIFMSVSISPEIAFQPTCLWQHHTVLKSFHLLDKTRMWGTVSHPWSQMRKTEEGMHGYFYFLYFDTNKESSNRGSQFMKGLLFFAWYNHNLWQGKDMNFIHFFCIYCQKYWQYMWKRLSGYFFPSFLFFYLKERLV